MKNMKKKIILLISLSLLILTSCSNEKEVLAELTNGDEKIRILRKDLKFVIDLNQLERKEISVAIQNQVLEELAFLTAGNIEYNSISNKQTELQKKAKKALALLDRKTFLNAMNYYLQEESSNFVYKMILMQAVFIRNDRNLDRTKEAEDLVNQLNKAKDEKEIEKIIFEKNENLRYKFLGGFVDPFCLNCGFNPISDITQPLMENKDKKFIMIQNPQGIWIVRNLEIKDVKQNQLKDLYEDYHKKTQFIARKFFENPGYTKNLDKHQVEQLKQQFLMDEKKITEFSNELANHQSKFLKRNILMNHINELKEKYKFKINKDFEQNFLQKNTQDWDYSIEIFELNKKKYLFQEFVDLIENENLMLKDFNKEELLNLFNQVYILSEILKLSPLAQKVDSIQGVFKDLIIKQNHTNLYIAEQMNNINISNQELMNYYELRKNNEFKGQNFTQVREKIKNNLLTEKRQKKLNEIKQYLFKKYKVKIEKEKLKEGKV